MILNNHEFDYNQTENGELILKVMIAENFEIIKLTKKKPETFELMNRKFNLIQEYPYNRQL